jgi:phenylpyruvate tautomerase PptA (4-oxalocrotonate tautomerase family)
MPHLSVYVSEKDLAGNEPDLIAALTDAVVSVYGDWVRDHVVVYLIGLPTNRWGIGGKPAADPAPNVTFGLRESVLTRPDADDIVARLIAGVTDALAGVLGERIRPGTTVELVGTRPGRTGLAGVPVTA